MKPYHYIIIILVLLLIFSIQQVFDQSDRIESLKNMNIEAKKRIEIVYDTIEIEIEKQKEIIKKDKEDEEALNNLTDADSIYKLFSKYYTNNEKSSETSY